MRILPILTPRLRRVLSPDGLSIGLWAMLVVGFELFGRRSRSDFEDAAGVALFLAAVLLTWSQHRRQPLIWVRALARGCERLLNECLARSRFKMGFDLRATPPLPRRIPPLLVMGIGAAGLTATLAFILRGHFPGDARAFLVGLSFSLYLSVLTLLWGSLVAGSVFLFSMPLVLIHSLLHERPWFARTSYVLRTWMVLGYLCLISIGAGMAPNWLPVALVAGAWTLVALVLAAPGGPRLGVVWKPSEAQAPAAVMDWSVLVLSVSGIYAAISVVPVLLARGDRFSASGSAETAITALLGLVYAWTSVGAVIATVGATLATVWDGRFGNPARPAPTRVHLGEAVEGGLVPPSVRRRARGVLSSFGFGVARRARRPLDVPIRLVPEGSSERFPKSGGWPRPVTPEQLADPGLHRALARRDELLRRRKSLHGLRHIFKIAAGREYLRGSGFWVAPHLWYVASLSRDEDEEDSWMIGPRYSRLIPLPARQHFNTVMQALEIDLIFVEDGVGFRRLKRVIGVLFESYDIFGGRRSAEERQFSGLPGVRVILHDFQLGAEWSFGDYPEPQYENLGRARILHVFRDRGGDAQEALSPGDTDLVPEPLVWA